MPYHLPRWSRTSPLPSRARMTGANTHNRTASKTHSHTLLNLPLAMSPVMMAQTVVYKAQNGSTVRRYSQSGLEVRASCVQVTTANASQTVKNTVNADKAMAPKKARASQFAMHSTCTRVNWPQACILYPGRNARIRPRDCYSSCHLPCFTTRLSHERSAPSRCNGELSAQVHLPHRAVFERLSKRDTPCTGDLAYYRVGDTQATCVGGALPFDRLRASVPITPLAGLLGREQLRSAPERTIE